MMEKAMMEAVAERGVGEAWRECRMRGKGRAREARTSETWADAAKARASAHAAEMHPASHGMHPHPSTAHGMHPHPSTTHAAGVAAKATAATAKATAAMAAATTTAPTSCECRWRKSERRTKRARDETTEKLAVHPIAP
jgi:hypothetical protein